MHLTPARFCIHCAPSPFYEDYKKMTPTERAEVDKMMAQLSEIIGLDDDDLD